MVAVSVAGVRLDRLIQEIFEALPELSRISESRFESFNNYRNRHPQDVFKPWGYLYGVERFYLQPDASVAELRIVAIEDTRSARHYWRCNLSNGLWGCFSSAVWNSLSKVPGPVRNKMQNRAKDKFMGWAMGEVDKIVNRIVQKLRDDGDKSIASAVNEVKNEGVEAAVAASAKTTAESRDHWHENTEACERCDTRFSMTKRRHHCRQCGRCVCAQCAKNKMVVSGCGDKPARVCDDCAALADAPEQSAPDDME
ncbi:MAG: hypothetical protein MHM6MM_003955 [Cercozoa sp. M6MM]